MRRLDRQMAVAIMIILSCSAAAFLAAMQFSRGGTVA
jgi:hypothetical protein